MATVTFPARCAVAVICGDHLISQVYPASVPIEVFLDDIVELLDDELQRRGATRLDSDVGYELHRANGTRLDVTRTLDELGIEDGTTLMVVPADEGDSFEPHYESLSTGLARAGKSLFSPVTVETAAHTAIGILAMVAATIVVLTIQTRLHTDSLAPAVAAGTIGLLLMAGACAVGRWWPERTDLLSGFAWTSVPLLAVGLGSAAPGSVGAPHVFIAVLAAGLLCYGLVAVTQRSITAGAVIVTLCAVGGLVAGARMWRPIPPQWLGMCTLIGLLVLLTMAPTFALWSAHIRPPRFGSITGRDLFRRGDGLPVDTVSPVDEDTSEESTLDDTPRGAAIAEIAKRANGALTGICIAAAITLPLAVWATLMPGHSRGNAAAMLAALFIVIFISRGRAFADKRQAVALVCGAAAAVCAGVVRYLLNAPADSTSPLLWGTLLLGTFAGAGLVAALLVPVTHFTPLVRMVTEWVELTAIVVAFPLAAWIGGLFTWIRMR